ncbi:ABC transporter ATP-binding protein [Bradyrhizobium mercantei]|uniref:ABC transporter ATP-binding protein n=1 Tax=Bradyrhizobium mercantei TaxID=1904807 RepID=UPI0009761C15|nr:ABC transporter ATP-binding protein [Bradyrhizobium mercantei]
MKQPILEVRKLQKSFGGLRALDGINLDIHEGEVVGLIGPNGAGKTALLNTVTGFYRATGGTILFQNQDITHRPMHEIGRLGIGRTFQNIRLFRRMTVLENALVAFRPFADHPLRSLIAYRERRMAIARAMHWLELLQLADKVDRIASSLSYGDARRLEIARALVGEPSLLLLDEPAAGMNENETRRLVDDIAIVRRHVRAIVLIEHDMDLIRSLSDRLVAMDYGRKIVEGASAEVLNHPEVLKAYLGTDTEETVS